MIDFTGVKSISIPEGVVKQITRKSDGVILFKSGPKNWIPYSTTADGKTIYNGGLGYKNNTRLNSSAAETGQDGYVTIGYIPAKAGDTVRVKGITWTSTYNTGGYFWVFDSSFTRQKSSRPSASSQDIVVTNEGNGVMAFSIQRYATYAAYFRFSAYGVGENLIVTVNEEIT